MRSVEDNGGYNYGTTPKISNNSINTFEFPKGNVGNRSAQHRMAMGKPTPSKWEDAQKWLVGLSKGGEKPQSKTKLRNSNADDTRLIAPVPQKEVDYSSGDDEVEKAQNESHEIRTSYHLEVETKKVDCNESTWRVNMPKDSSKSAIRSICVRDMGTEMTPIASVEPSRSATPIRVTTPVAQSHISSWSSSPVLCQHVAKQIESRGDGVCSGLGNCATRWSNQDKGESNSSKLPENNSSEQVRKISPLETRAIAWDEAERAKYLERYKREEVKIQAWENHQKRNAEMEMRRIEVKAERLKTRSQEMLTNKISATRRIAEEKRANAEAELNEKAVKTSERADYIRRTGHLPSSFSFKLPSLCW